MTEGVQDVELTRQDIVNMLRPCYEAQEERKGYGKTEDRYRELIKDYLLKHDEREVWVEYGDRQLVAHLIGLDSAGSETYDIQRASDELILLLHRLNLLTVNAAGVKAQGAGSEVYGRLKPFITRKASTPRLMVEVK